MKRWASSKERLAWATALHNFSRKVDLDRAALICGPDGVSDDIQNEDASDLMLEACAHMEIARLLLKRASRICAMDTLADPQLLTTQQAADLLNVSRTHLTRLLRERRIPYTKVSKQRRLKIEDVLAYKEERDRARAALDELTAISQE